MKKILSAAVTAAMTVGLSALCFIPKQAEADNPMIQTIFSTDPAPMVYDDTLYVYTGRDKPNSDFYYMPDWHCYSTTDMQNWTDHGMILSWDSFTWGKEDSAWASQCIERNGKFYYYVTLENKSGGGRAIGVAVADSPTGPFKDAIGKPLCGPNWDYIDPTVFIDDDGQAWLMFGNPTCYYVKLKEDMVTLDGQIGNFDMNSSTFGPGGSKASSYGEGPWFYKRNNLYYLVYAAFYNGEGSESIGYSTAPSPTGPWTYKGQVMKKHNCFTNHPGVVDYKGNSYFFYHDASLKNGGTFDRSVCVERFEYKADGSIPTISPSKTGPQQLEALNPFKRTEAETICFSEGVATESCSEGGLDVANIENGDYVKVKGVNFGDGADTFNASIASATDGGQIKLHIDSLSGEVIGTCNVPATDGWQNWTEVSCDVDVSGEHDLYLEFTGGSGYLFNVDWWSFEGAGSSGQGSSETKEGILNRYGFESSTESWNGRGDASVASDSKTAFAGSKSLYVSGRTAAWNGASRKLTSTYKAGETYSFSANVKYTTGKTDTDTFFMKLEYEDADGETQYSTIAEGTAIKGEWVQLANTDYTIPEGASNISFYIETEDSKNSFYLDDVCVATAGTKIEGAGVYGKLIQGDVDYDGSITALDMTAARNVITGKNKNAYAKLAADVDKSTEVEINDAVLLKEYLVGKIESFPDNSPEPPEQPKSDFDYQANLQFKEAPGNYLSPCSQAGKVITESYNGINGGNTLNVYLPYGYDESRKYNIFYLMHGGGENENTIFSKDCELDNILDHMIMNGELEPLIVVTPTFNKCTAQTFYKEFRQSVIPFVESKYSTYANGDTSADSIAASRMHRAYGGFSMGSASTWAVLINSLDICGYYMPLSGDNWESSGGGYDKAKSVADAVDRSGLSDREYFIMAATGSEDIAYPNMNPQMDEMKKMKQFTYTSDFSQGNFYYLVAQGKTHWWGYVRHYIYDALPYFFHEGQ